MDPSPLRFHHCRCKIWKISSRNLGLLLGTICTVTQMMRLCYNPEWISYTCHAYTRGLTTFICNGWAYGSITTPFLPLQVRAQIRKICRYLGLLLGTKCTVTQMVRLFNHPELLSHLCHTYITCLTAAICNGWAYGSTIIPFSLQVQAQIWQISKNLGLLLGTMCTVPQMMRLRNHPEWISHPCYTFIH